MHFLFLCDQLAGYWHHCIVRLAESVPGARVTVVAPPGSPLAPFDFPEHPAVVLRDRSQMDWPAIKQLVADRPDFVYLAGWGDPLYRRVGAMVRRQCPVVMGSDNLWVGSFRQHVAATLLAPAIRRFCTHMWIPGLYQYEFARRLGFPKDRILTGMYTASTGLYEFASRGGEAAVAGAETIIFVGRLSVPKGVDDLVTAFTSIERRFPAWKLRLVGDGPLRSRVEGLSPRVEVTGFVQPKDLPRMFAAAGAFCLPSHDDHWAVVIHEACCASLPVVATTACGATSTLVHDGYNGFRCEARNVPSLRSALVRLMELSPEKRGMFGLRSRQLSEQFTPDLWVATMMSTLRRD